MGYHLTTNGQDQLTSDDIQAATVQVSLYNDSTDSVAVGGTTGDISTEPSGGSFSKQSAGFSQGTSGGYVQLTGDTVTFNTSDSSQTVDSYYYTRDPGTGTELILTGQLGQQRDLSQIDSLEVSGHGFEFTA